MSVLVCFDLELNRAMSAHTGKLSVRMSETGKLRESLQAKEQQAVHYEEQQAAADERIQVRRRSDCSGWLLLLAALQSMYSCMCS
jgi:hypothetical protein